MKLPCPVCGVGAIEAPRQPLTRVQSQVLAYLTAYTAAEGMAPSFSEIARHFGYTSLATVHEHIRTLKTKGYITTSYNKQRSIVVLPTAEPRDDA